jgi:hypothetical protein
MNMKQIRNCVLRTQLKSTFLSCLSGTEKKIKNYEFLPDGQGATDTGIQNWDWVGPSSTKKI